MSLGGFGKRIPLACLLVFASVFALPEYDAPTKGSVMMSGSIAVRNTVNAPAEWASNHILVDPAVMFFVTQGLGLGAGLTVGVMDHYETQVEFGMGPRAEYYFGRPDARSHPFLGGGVWYRGRSTGSGTWSGIGFDFALGVAHMVGHRFGTLVKLGYLWETLSQTGRPRASGVFTIAVGIAGWAHRAEQWR